MNEPGQPAVPGASPARAPEGQAGGGQDDVRELVRRSLEGDEAAHAEIFRRYRDKVHRISFRFTRDEDEAMDLTQTAFIKAFRSLSSYREEAAFGTWIARVATNTGIDHVRARKRGAQVRLDDALDVSGQGEPLVTGREKGPAGSALNEELGRALQAAVERLSEKHRPVFVLHCVEGMPYQAIADTLGISIGTVMSRLFHARRYLRQDLAPYLGETRVRTLLKGQADEVAQAMGAERAPRAARKEG